jgi:hypothetical protein
LAPFWIINAFRVWRIGRLRDLLRLGCARVEKWRNEQNLSSPRLYPMVAQVTCAVTTLLILPFNIKTDLLPFGRIKMHMKIQIET